jgi:hypothetical protein
LFRLSGMFYGEFWLSYGELHASWQNENVWMIILSIEKGWAQGFLRRNRELRVSIPEPATVIRILDFNTIDATRIYDNLVTVFEIYELELNHIVTCTGDL